MAAPHPDPDCTDAKEVSGELQKAEEEQQNKEDD